MAEITVDQADLDAWRLRLRAWLPEHLPRLDPTVRWDPINDDDDRANRYRQLQRIIFDGGYAGICYPKAYGGQGLSVEYQEVFNEEALGYELPMLGSSPTMSICGPTVLDCATETQKQDYIPKFLSGEHLWVQFISEPSGGSDMAGALTRADRDGDVWIMNGAKIWSTYAYKSDMALCLARTNWDVPKHRGLTMFMVPVHHPGITINQIKMVDGNVEFCEEHFEDVVLTKDHLLGEENDGWTIAGRLLFHERSAVGGFSPYHSMPRTRSTEAATGTSRYAHLARSHGRTDDPIARRLVGQGEVHTIVNQQLVGRVGHGIATGAFPGHAASLARLSSGRTATTTNTITTELAGDDPIAWPPGSNHQYLGTDILYRQALSIAGGTTEMASNLIAERVLGMPHEWSADRDIPFNQVPRGPTQRP